MITIYSDWHAKRSVVVHRAAGLRLGERVIGRGGVKYLLPKMGI